VSAVRATLIQGIGPACLHQKMGNKTPGSPTRIDPVPGWRSRLTWIVSAILLFLLVTGLTIYLLPFSKFNQMSVLLHTLAGLVVLAPLVWFVWRHWVERKRGKLSHFQLLGYLALSVLAVCAVSGVVLTWQGVAATRIGYTWDLVHLVSGVAFALFVSVHFAALVVRRVLPHEVEPLRAAQKGFWIRISAACAVLLVVTATIAMMYREPEITTAFPDDYNWRFGEDRPFAPSMARVDYGEWEGETVDQARALLDGGAVSTFVAAMARPDPGKSGLFARIRTAFEEAGATPDQIRQMEEILAEALPALQEQGAVNPMVLANSAGCGRGGCHEQIYEEWLPSAHRYSSLDDMFQKVQEIMVAETAPEFTRYCAGCHDPISLFSGAKNEGNLTLSVEGANEGSSCVVCHSIVQADIQGNGDYTIRPPRHYAWEHGESAFDEFLSGFLIRTYPKHHISTYSRPLYKTPEFCGACHKQYIDKEVNVDIGKVQGQNQYDSWRNSRWRDPDDPEKTVVCRECHMPLTASSDPARGDMTDYNRTPDDEKHRGHRMLGGNQYIPTLQGLEGGEEHVDLIEQWLRGEIEIPEIADKWTTGPAIRLGLVVPDAVAPGDDVSLRITMINNKTGHDFPTGPLDMIESWIEVKVTDDTGVTVFHTGYVDESGAIVDTPVWFKADGFDREGKLIDRHNLWDLVGASYKRVLYPGMTDTVAVSFTVPGVAWDRLASLMPDQVNETEGYAFPSPVAQAPGKLTVTVILWYRKANPEFLDRVYGHEANIRSPLTRISSVTATIKVSNRAGSD